MNMEKAPQTTPTLRSVPGRRRWPTIVLMVVVFAAGAAIGAAGTVLYFDRINQYYRAHPEKLPERIASRIAKEMDLSSEQAPQARQIVAEWWQAMQEVRHQSYPLYKPPLDRMDQQMSALLNDRQKQKWNEYFASIRRMYNPDKTAATHPAQ
jgi:hypothetical protein